MHDCNNEISKYHAEAVRLAADKNRQLTARRKANRKRVRRGLTEAGHHQPEEFVVQGSRAARTTIQEPDNQYDIDDGVVFAAEDLVGSLGAPLSPLDARKRVRDAVDDGSFKTPPIVKENCVRIFYDDGPHVDQPVYRHLGDGKLELAGATWKKSDPRGVKNWFNACLNRKIGGGAADQMRALIRLFKAYCKNRTSVSLPSGFALTVLVDECFHIENGRLDQAFRSTMQAMHTRLTGNLVVNHPVVSESIIGDAQANLTRNLRDELGKSLSELRELDSGICTRVKALKIWKKVFRTSHFDDLIATAENEQKTKTCAAVVGLGVTAPRQWADR